MGGKMRRAPIIGRLGVAMLFLGLTAPAGAQDMGGIAVDRPIPRGECGVGTRGGDRFMICRDANGALRNEGLIRGGSAAPSASGPAAVPAQGAPARSAPSRDRRLAGVPIDRTTHRFGQVVVEGCEAIYGLMEGFDAAAFNARRSGTALYDGSEFRIANFLSNEETKRRFGLELSAWTADQKLRFLEHSRLCALEADRLAYNPDSEPELRPHAAAIRAYGAAMRDLHNYLPGAFELLAARADLIEQLNALVGNLRTEQLAPDALLRLAAIQDPGALAGLGGRFAALSRLDLGGRDDVYKAFAAIRDQRVEEAMADARQAVSAAAGAPATAESFRALSQKLSADPFFARAANQVPDHPKVAPVVAQLRGIANQVRDIVMRDFDAKVGASPLTIAGADAIRQAAADVAAMGLQLAPESRAKAEERFRAGYRAGLVATERALQSVDIRSYRDFGKIDAAFDANFPAADPSVAAAGLTLGPVMDDLNRLSATVSALKRRAAETHFQAFARDLAAVPNTQAGWDRIDKEFIPLLAHIEGPAGETYRRAIDVKLTVVNEGIGAQKCAEELAKNGISRSEGERQIVGPRGAISFAEFACRALDANVRIYDLKIPNLITGLISSKITFRVGPSGDLPFTVEAEERDLDGGKAIVGIRAIQDVSQRAIALRLDDWRDMVQNPRGAHRIFER